MAFQVDKYPVSWIELFGVITGIFCVYLAAVHNILTWPFGILTSVCFISIFYQVRLYSDLLLQLYFFASSVYGWIFWKGGRETHTMIQSLGLQNRIQVGIGIFLTTILLGRTTQYFPHWMPNWFLEPPAFPYLDAFTTTASIVANLLLVWKKRESWYLWVLVDLVCIYIYWELGILFVMCEYILLLVFAFLGIWYWQKFPRQS